MNRNNLRRSRRREWMGLVLRSFLVWGSETQALVNSPIFYFRSEPLIRQQFAQTLECSNNLPVCSSTEQGGFASDVPDMIRGGAFTENVCQSLQQVFSIALNICCFGHCVCATIEKMNLSSIRNIALRIIVQLFTRFMLRTYET